MSAFPAPAPRLRHRIPKSLRRHWKLPVAFIAFVVLVATVFGSTRVRPYISGDATVIASEITRNITGTVDLFDASVAHELSIEIGASRYDDMIATFRKSGDKKWVTASIVIDGTRIDDVGVRLKGNSTLGGLRGDDAFGTGPGAVVPPEGFEAAPAPPGMAGMSQVTPDDPASLPLLISFDENADGRAYQGMTEISIRPGSPVLNEAMALSLTAETGQPTQRYAYTVYSVNDSPTTTRLVLEHPDETYANSLFDSDGYLYKADASSQFEYVGDDQSAYADQFKQINATDSGTLQPIIDFLKWMDSADDAEFDEHLADRVDVESFARYVATQNLLVNTDDMSGPGQNYYLWYDLETTKLSVISWDLNLAMQGDTSAGPDDIISIGPGTDRMPAGDRQPASVPADRAQPDPAAFGDTGTPGMRFGGVPPQGAPPAGTVPPSRPGGTIPGAGQDSEPDTETAPDEGRLQRAGSALKTRFLASGAFADLYESTYWILFEQIYGGGRAAEILDAVAASLPTSDALTAEERQNSIDSMLRWIERRTSDLGELRDR